MSKSAIVSLLWPKNFGVLESFVRDNPDTLVLAAREPSVPDLATRLRAAGGELWPLDGLVSSIGVARARAKSKPMLSRLEAVLAEDEWRRFASDKGWSARHLGAVIDMRAQIDLPELVVTLAALERARSMRTVRLVIVNEDFTPVPRTVVLWAKERGIPSLHLEHALTLNEPFAVHGRILSDILAVFGDSGVEPYLDGGTDVPAGCIRVTGNPAWDVYAETARQRQATRKDMAAKNNCSLSSSWAVFATTWGANWPARSEADAYTRTLRQYLQACKTLVDAGTQMTIIVKDRPPNREFGRARLAELVAELGIDGTCVRYATDDIEKWVAAADVVVSVESNTSVEAILASTPAINLVTEMDTTMGPTFDAESGMVEAEGHELADALKRILSDEDYRDHLRDQMREAAPRYNIGFDGSATARVVELMEELALPADGRRGPR